jgi:hypothetical protein
LAAIHQKQTIIQKRKKKIVIEWFWELENEYKWWWTLDHDDFSEAIDLEINYNPDSKAFDYLVELEYIGLFKRNQDNGKNELILHHNPFYNDKMCSR